ncbi:hypothetical protein MMC17_006077 [Xylographa soralifera]|nr:hypothetical protein [Xylographa soralifera]
MTSKQAKAFFKRKCSAEARKNYRLWKIAQWKERRESEKNLPQHTDQEKLHPQAKQPLDSEGEDSFVVDDSNELDARHYVYDFTDDEESDHTRMYTKQGASQVKDRLLEPTISDEIRSLGISWAKRDRKTPLSGSQTFTHIDDLVEFIDISDHPYLYKAAPTCQPSDLAPPSLQPSKKSLPREKRAKGARTTSLEVHEQEPALIVEGSEDGDLCLSQSQRKGIKRKRNPVHDIRELDMIQFIDMYDSDGRDEEAGLTPITNIVSKTRVEHNKKRCIRSVGPDSSDGEDFETMILKKLKHKIQSGQLGVDKLATAIVPVDTWLSQSPSSSEVEQEIFNPLVSLNPKATPDSMPGKFTENAPNKKIINNEATVRQDENCRIEVQVQEFCQTDLPAKTQSLVQLPTSPVAQGVVFKWSRTSKHRTTVQDSSIHQAPLIVTATPIYERCPTPHLANTCSAMAYQVQGPRTPRVARVLPNSAVLVPRTPPVGQTSRDSSHILVPRTPRVNQVCPNPPRIVVARTPPVRQGLRNTTAILVPRTPSFNREGSVKKLPYIATCSPFFDFSTCVLSTRRGDKTIKEPMSIIHT